MSVCVCVCVCVRVLIYLGCSSYILGAVIECCLADLQDPGSNTSHVSLYLRVCLGVCIYVCVYGYAYSVRCVCVCVCCDALHRHPFLMTVSDGRPAPRLYRAVLHDISDVYNKCSNLVLLCNKKETPHTV